VRVVRAAAVDLQQFYHYRLLLALCCIFVEHKNIQNEMESFQFTAIIEEGLNGWFVGQVEEVPEAISQGKTVEELLENLTDAVKVVLQAKSKIKTI